MPLSTQVVRDGEPLSIAWGGFHVAAMCLAAMCEAPQEEWHERIADMVHGDQGTYTITPGDVFALTNYSVLATTVLNASTCTLRNTYTFIDATDGEVFILHKGDELRAWRS